MLEEGRSGLSNRSSNKPNKEKYVLSVGIEHYLSIYFNKLLFNPNFMKIVYFSEKGKFIDFI